MYAARQLCVAQRRSRIRTMTSLEPQHAVIRGLRDVRSETELTRTLAAVLDAEPAMAGDFVRLVLRSAPRSGHIDGSRLPPNLRCEAEQTLEEGRVDLTFSDVNGEWRVLVEIKIDAGYGHEQIRRYLRSFRGDPRRTVLVAITRNVPTYGDFGDDDPSWAGSVQWAKLLPGLRTLQPANSSLALQWPLFLDVLESEGSMGFTQPDVALFRAWAQYVYARGHMVDFVDSVRRPLLDALHHALAATADGRQPAELAAFRTRGKKAQRVVVPRFGKVVVGFRVPAHGPERFWAGLWGWAEPRFMVEIPYPKPDAGRADARAAALAALHDAGFESWRNRILTRYLPLTDELLRSRELEDTVVDFARASFGSIVESGVLGLAAEPLPETEDDDVI